MKKILILLIVVIFLFSNISFALPSEGKLRELRPEERTPIEKANNNGAKGALPGERGMSLGNVTLTDIEKVLTAAYQVGETIQTHGKEIPSKQAELVRRGESVNLREFFYNAVVSHCPASFEMLFTGLGSEDPLVRAIARANLIKLCDETTSEPIFASFLANFRRPDTRDAWQKELANLNAHKEDYLTKIDSLSRVAVKCIAKLAAFTGEQPWPSPRFPEDISGNLVVIDKDTVLKNGVQLPQLARDIEIKRGKIAVSGLDEAEQLVIVSWFIKAAGDLNSIRFINDPKDAVTLAEKEGFSKVVYLLPTSDTGQELPTSTEIVEVKVCRFSEAAGGQILYLPTLIASSLQENPIAPSPINAVIDISEEVYRKKVIDDFNAAMQSAIEAARKI